MDPTSVDYYNKIDDLTFLQMCQERFNESDGFYNTKKDNQNRKLKSIRDDNRKNYTAEYIEEQLIDTRYEEVFSDNRMFINVRTVVPFVTGQVTSPEVTPANNDELSMLFATDFEKALQMEAEKGLCKYKIRLSVQDLLIGERVGIGKWRYDATLDKLVYDHISPDSVTIGVRAGLYEEPDWVQHRIKKTVAQIISMFPDKKQEILEHFGVEDKPDQWEKTRYKIKEDWLFVWEENDNEMQRCLVVGWSHADFSFGKILDPNWNPNGNNVLDEPMMPFVFYNVLNSGRSHIDDTSYAEQAKYNQKNYNKRGQTIAESARYSGTGVPIFAKGSISQKDAAKVHFSPVQRILLDTPNVANSFTVWQAQQLPAFIQQDKIDLKNSIDEIYGSPDINHGENSGNPTATQDILVRDQAQGRQTDLLDMLEVSMTRFYQLEAQLMYRYYTKTKYFNYLGNNNKFISVAINSHSIRKNIGIQIGIKAGTSLPIDRAQKRQTLVSLAEQQRISTYTLYKELGLFDDPEQAYKEWLTERNDPASMLSNIATDIFDRDANEDLQTVIGGQMPDERDDITPEYVNFLNNWLMTDKYKHLREDNPKAAARVSDFIDQVIAQAKRKAIKQQLQPNPASGNTPSPQTPGGTPPMMMPAMGAAMNQQPPMPPNVAQTPVSGPAQTPLAQAIGGGSPQTPIGATIGQ